MKILAQHNRIVWVNYHGTRRPRLTIADIKASLSVLSRFRRGAQSVSSTFTHITPLVIPGARNRVTKFLHHSLLEWQIRRTIKSMAGASDYPIQVWSFAPDVPDLVGCLDEECFVYYCVDEHSEFEGYDKQAILDAEKKLLTRADIVLTTSEALLERKREHRPDAVLVQHGVDFDHFSSAWRSDLPVPKDIADIPGPVFGFFGLIQFWVDRELIARLAKRRPNYSFVLIGDRLADTSMLEKLPNVHLLGRRSNTELPAYCANFVAGLMPFVRNDMVRSVNPIKMYEYLAAGLPVISTPLPEANRFLGPIVFEESADGFAQACDKAISTDHPGRRAEISRWVEKESWASKVDHLSNLVEQTYTTSVRHAQKPRQAVLPASTKRSNTLPYESTNAQS